MKRKFCQIALLVLAWVFIAYHHAFAAFNQYRITNGTAQDLVVYVKYDRYLGVPHEPSPFDTPIDTTHNIPAGGEYVGTITSPSSYNIWKVWIVAAPMEKVGNSWVSSGPAENVYVWEGEDIADLGNIAHVQDMPISASVLKSATPEEKKTLWMVEEDPENTGALTSMVFREGIDKVVYAMENSGPDATGSFFQDFGTAPAGDDLTAMQAAINAQKAVYEEFTADATNQINTAAMTALGTISTGMPAPEPDPDFTFGTILTPIKTFELTPFSGDSGVPAYLTYATIMREIFLVLMGIGFCVFMQMKFEQYYCDWWKIPGHTTQPNGPLDTIQAVGWGKQLANAAILIAALIATVAIVIASINSKAAEIMAGVNTGNIMAEFTTTWGESMGNSGFAKAVALLGLFFPFAAMFQFFAARYLIGWTMPFLWTGAIVAAKYVRL